MIKNKTTVCRTCKKDTFIRHIGKRGFLKYIDNCGKCFEEEIEIKEKPTNNVDPYHVNYHNKPKAR